MPRTSFGTPLLNRWTTALIVLFGLFAACFGRVASAQEAASPAPAAAAPAPAAVPPAADASAPRQEDSMLMWLIKTSGWIGAIILALSIYFVTVVVQTFLDLWS